ncbi:winged helix DNA-binding domain-containing protein [Streptomyces sp. HNM0575]|uniref:winged helix DNA-binding domain-containing protein n=1 Tax=Streptomyces sp. HNM0575 TaxID=2716338 RepID=UPI00145E1DC5|nr:winged helix DNA-binding domain-containing protein [Streptomyces sp. HNM0575]NLU71230.1 winged helix DNA-binding domain-containing protein [Streptomyces sp. HNM0575]
MQPATLTARALGRALVSRQLLAAREGMTALEAVEHLVGMQAQAPRPPYFGLWSRLVDFRAAELSGLLRDRAAVRVSVMRGTVHLVSAADCLQLRPLTRVLYERLVRSDRSRRLRSADPWDVAAAADSLVRQEPRMARELGGLLHERWPDEEPEALSRAARSLCDVVQIPPRGLWGRSGQPSYSAVETWLGRPVSPEPCVETVLLRYLGAFGPATVMDAQTWSGLTRLGEVMERLRPQLRVFRSESGRELFDLPDAPRPDPELPLPARFVAEYDNLVLSHADRTRVIGDAARKLIASRNGQVPGTVLLDGQVRGTWKLERPRKGASTLTVTPFLRRFTGDEERELAAEGERLMAFARHGGAGAGGGADTEGGAGAEAPGGAGAVPGSGGVTAPDAEEFAVVFADAAV